MEIEEHVLLSMSDLASEKQIATRCGNLARALETAYVEARLTDRIQVLQRTYRQLMDGDYEARQEIFRCQSFKSDVSVPIVA